MPSTSPAILTTLPAKPASVLPIPIIIPKPKPKSLRTKHAIRRLWVKSPTTASPPILSFPIQQKMSEGDGVAEEPNKLSALAESVKNDGFMIDGGIETRPAENKKKENPLPKFLKLSRSDRSMRFTDLEWQARQRLLEGLKASEQAEHSSLAGAEWARLKGDEITARNRYMNVDPYANNRVKLHVAEGQSDYINASPIRIPTSAGQDKKFIATQGPKESTVPHFWRMILDSPSNLPTVIVMLTQLVEANREKCFQYFPSSPEQSTLTITDPDDPLFSATVKLESIHENTPARTIVREITVSSADGRSKKVYHLLFDAWPDFLVPEGDDRKSLLNLIKLSRRLSGGAESERIVHCSAGVGRSGTFIALDHLIDEVQAGTLDTVESKDDEEEDPIVELVDRLRQQRMMMVQGEMQFTFLYEVVAEKWLERWKKEHPE